MAMLYIALGVMSMMLLLLLLLMIPMAVLTGIAFCERQFLTGLFHMVLFGMLVFVMLLGGSVWMDYFQLLRSIS